MLSATPGGQLALVCIVPPAWPAPCLRGSAHTQNKRFSGLRFRFRAYTLHLAALACLPFRLSPSSHYTSERLTRPYSGELPASAALSQLANIARLPRQFLMFRPPSLLTTQVVPTVGSFFSPRPPWLFRPRISRFVTSPSSGYANRPNRATDGRGTFTSWIAVLSAAPSRTGFSDHLHLKAYKSAPLGLEI